jgi:hypothetical protein
MLQLHFDVSDVTLHRLERRQGVALFQKVFVGTVAAVQSLVSTL